MESAIIKILVEGGPYGAIAGILIYMWRKDKLMLERDKMWNKTINNHLDHANDSRDRHREATKSLTEALINLKGVIKGCPNNKLNK